MPKLKKLFLILVVITAIFISAPVKKVSAVSVSIDGKQVVFTQDSGYPFIDTANRTQVPLRVTMEAYGCTADWNRTNEEAIVKKDGITVQVPIDKSYIIKDGNIIANDTVAKVINGRTYLPIRAVLEAFGGTVKWNSNTSTVIVSSSKLPNNAHTTTVQGVTFTINDNGSITTDGTNYGSSPAATYIFGSNESNPDNITLEKDYKISIASSGFGFSSLTCYAVVYTSMGYKVLTNYEVSLPAGTIVFGLHLRVAPGQTAHNVIFIPKLEEVSDNAIFSYFGATTSKTINMGTGETLFLKVDKTYNVIIRAFGVTDNVETPLSITNMITGGIGKEIVQNGIFQIDTQNYSFIKLTRTNSNSSGNQYSSVTRIQSTISPPQISQDRGYPINPNVTSTVMDVPGIKILGVRNGKLVGSKIINGIAHLVESDTNYTNFTDLCAILIKTHPLQMEVAGDGSIIALTDDGKVWRYSNKSITNVLKLDQKPYIYGAFPQIDVYGSYVFISEYIQPINYNSPVSSTHGGKLYFSTDNGSTFKTIFDIEKNIGSTTTDTHIHTIKYDPYEKLIWMVTGDGLGHQSVRYSHDLGYTWHLATPLENSATQYTTIIPLPDCVLFGSDSRIVGVGRYNRPSGGTIPGAEMHFDYPFFMHQFLSADGVGIPVTARAAINSKDGLALFGYFMSAESYTQNPVELFGRCTLWLTNGYKLYQVYQHDEVVTNCVTGCFYDDVNKKYIARLGLDGLIVVISKK